MKRFLLLLLLLPTLAFAQKRKYTMADVPMAPIDSVTGHVAYIGVVEVPGATADQLYTRAKAYLFKTFVNASAVIQVDDKSGGLLAGKGLVLLPGETASKQAFRAAMLGPGAGDGIYYRLPIEFRFKDGKYRYEISHIQIVMGATTINLDDHPIPKFDPSQKISEGQYKKYMQTHEMFQTFIDNLKLAMKQTAGKEDW
ncbi:hypothetical protein BN8_03698 [Fibrisoma limi BUZ 3]|uniref:DUF4468 domain-containing protein n=1 Tax=Fibrisoma limi BUZ 3 TaxID=1185876 RepID=I2GKU2_9BACT|nr:DUF4468 domain-containing protein [Fibrisoma limi]CCH54518.1 hypothetical protein BN8_03698 [Fibrisoma limi BUZ 3]